MSRNVSASAYHCRQLCESFAGVSNLNSSS